MSSRHGRQFLHIDLDRTVDLVACAAEVREWIAAFGIEVLNVAGPRASGCREIAQDVRALVRTALRLGVIRS
jgi:hypothetical protein